MIRSVCADASAAGPGRNPTRGGVRRRRLHFGRAAAPLTVVGRRARAARPGRGRGRWAWPSSSWRPFAPGRAGAWTTRPRATWARVAGLRRDQRPARHDQHLVARAAGRRDHGDRAAARPAPPGARRRRRGAGREPHDPVPEGDARPAGAGRTRGGHLPERPRDRGHVARDGARARRAAGAAVGGDDPRSGLRHRGRGRRHRAQLAPAERRGGRLPRVRRMDRARGRGRGGSGRRRRAAPSRAGAEPRRRWPAARRRPRSRWASARLAAASSVSRLDLVRFVDDRTAFAAASVVCGLAGASLAAAVAVLLQRAARAR